MANPENPDPDPEKALRYLDLILEQVKRHIHAFENLQPPAEPLPPNTVIQVNIGNYEWFKKALEEIRSPLAGEK